MTVIDVDGTSALYRAESVGLSYWETLGMLYDSLHGMTSEAAWGG